MYQHILVSTDLSPHTKSTLNAASALAKKLGARLSVVHVVEPMYYHGYPYVAEFESALLEHAKTEMQKLCEAYGVTESDRHIVNGSVKAEIAHIADEIGADLIAVGSHGHHGLAKLMGSSASGVVHHAHQDVIVIRAKE